METYIEVKEARFYAFHGVLPQERRVGGEYFVTLRVHYNITRAMETDDVADTLNYAELCRLIEREMVLPSHLLEHVAGRIARSVFREYPEATVVDLWLTKVNPPMGADCAGAGVHLECRREEAEH